MKDGALNLTDGRSKYANAAKESDLNKRSVGKSQRASYTPDSNINEHAYGKDGGKPAALGTVPSVVVGGASETAALPKAFTGNFTVGEDKNVSEIV
jgi:hypothetical protein